MTSKEMAPGVKATMTSHKDRLQHSEKGNPERIHLRQGLALEMLIKDFENQAQTNADGILARRENAKIKETVVFSPETLLRSLILWIRRTLAP